MFLQNDDDLFEYEPEETSLPNFSTDSDQSNLSQSEKDFLDSIKVSEKNNIGSVNATEAQLSLAYLASSHFFVKSETVFTGHSFAIRYALDELTNGRFSLLELLKTTEAKIIRLSAFITLSESIFGDETQSFIETLNNLFNSNIGPIHANAIYGTHLAISRHSLAINRCLYSQLCHKLNMPLNPSLFDDDYSLDDVDFSYQEFTSNIHSNIISELALEGLTDKVSEAFSQNVQLYKNQS